MSVALSESPSTGNGALQTRLRLLIDRIETLLEAERGQLALWLPVMWGLGIALWFTLPRQAEWIATICGGLALAVLGLAIGRWRRLGSALMWTGILIAGGCAMIWVRAELMNSRPLDYPNVMSFSAQVTRVELNRQLGQIRYFLIPDNPQMPERVRVSTKIEDENPAIVPGAYVKLRARLTPPADAAVPGAYDFGRAAWFQGIGASGKVLGPIERLDKGGDTTPSLRQRLSAHIAAQIGEKGEGIAAALVAGDQGRVTAGDQQAMRASGLTHLLSVSGLHITAVIAAAMFLTLRLLALSPALALRWRLPLVAAGVGAAAGIGYTVLTGAEVPTLRSCIAALLVLVGLAMGREAMSLRLVAAGALAILVFGPDALIGPSFQLSFAAITSLVALHEHPKIHAFFEKREEGLLRRMMRGMGSLLLTGLVVELALSPIALYFFHRSGFYGALANIVAIPLTTFVIMPLEALALLFDSVGLGGPFWWLAGKSIGFLLWIARTTTSMPGAQALLPEVPLGAYALMIAGGLWIFIWKTKWRRFGAIAVIFGALWSILLPAPDIIITNDGRHVAIRGDDGRLGLLRVRAGDYVRETLAQRGGAKDLDDLENMAEANCSDDTCLVELKRGARDWRILATRSNQTLPWVEFTQACAKADIVISDRRLPKGCTPKWFKADKPFLATHGGLALTLSPMHVANVRDPADEHPWRSIEGE